MRTRHQQTTGLHQPYQERHRNQIQPNAHQRHPFRQADAKRSSFRHALTKPNAASSNRGKRIAYQADDRSKTAFPPINTRGEYNASAHKGRATIPAMIWIRADTGAGARGIAGRDCGFHSLRNLTSS